jgi:hypothetical protein
VSSAAALWGDRGAMGDHEATGMCDTNIGSNHAAGDARGRPCVGDDPSHGYIKYFCKTSSKKNLPKLAAHPF